MITLIIVAFLAGMLTIASPCVLTVLPILLSTSIGGGKLRPVGIVLGFAVAFTAFTLAFAGALQALALPASWLRIGVIMALGIFGLSLLIPPLGRAWERLLAPLARVANPGPARSGFGGGLLIGSGLGLLWAPCAGPLMGFVIGLTAYAGLSPEGVAITLAYTLGAGVPMLLIAYGTRSFTARAKRLGRRTGVIQQTFGALTVLVAVALLFGLDTQIQSFAQRSLPSEWSAALTSLERQDSVQTELDRLNGKSSAQAAGVLPTPTPETIMALEDMGPAPEFTGLTDWFNSEPLTMSDLRGKVVLIDFWTFGCYNCRNTRPHVRALFDKYKDQGLEIIGVHAPEFAYEKVPANVREAAKEQGVTWPVALDQEFKTWRSYDNHYWPALYLIDANGHLRYKHFGEGNYENNEKAVMQLLSEATSSAEQVDTVDTQAAMIAQVEALPTQEPPTVMPPTEIPPTAVLATATPAPGLVLEDKGLAPELVGLTDWFNSEPLTMEQLKGKVVIIDFWTFGCYNCRNTQPHVRALYDRYKDQGLEIIGVHTPEFAYEKVPANVRAAAKEQGVTWPVGLDQNFKTWGAYNNRYWPAFYFIDAKGHIRYQHFGEGNYEYNEKVVQQLLSEAKTTSLK